MICLLWGFYPPMPYFSDWCHVLWNMQPNQSNQLCKVSLRMCPRSVPSQEMSKNLISTNHRAGNDTDDQSLAWKQCLTSSLSPHNPSNLNQNLISSDQEQDFYNLFANIHHTPNKIIKIPIHKSSPDRKENYILSLMSFWIKLNIFAFIYIYSHLLIFFCVK